MYWQGFSGFQKMDSYFSRCTGYEVFSHMRSMCCVSSAQKPELNVGQAFLYTCPLMCYDIQIFAQFYKNVPEIFSRETVSRPGELPGQKEIGK